MSKILAAILVFGSLPALATSLKLESCRIDLKSPDSKYMCSSEELSSTNTAFVFVDFWREYDNQTVESRKHAAQLLKKLRENNFFVIHGAGNAIMREPGYKRLRKEVKEFLGDNYCKTNSNFGNENRQALYGYLNANDECPESVPFSEHLSTIVVPRNNRKGEFLVRYEDEMRFVLWKNKIRNLVYLGGAIDECVLHRPYGINPLVGTDVTRMNLNIYVIEDLVVGLPNFVSGITENQKNEVILKSLSSKLARVVSSQTFRFE